MFDNYYIGLPFFSLALTICSYLWLNRITFLAFSPGSDDFLGWCVLCAFVYLFSQASPNQSILIGLILQWLSLNWF